MTNTVDELGAAIDRGNEPLGCIWSWAEQLVRDQPPHWRHKAAEILGRSDCWCLICSSFRRRYWRPDWKKLGTSECHVDGCKLIEGHEAAPHG